MRKNQFDPARPAANCWEASERITRATWALENAKPEIVKVLIAGHAHPAFRNIDIELKNLDYVLRSLPFEREDEGRPQHPDAIKRGPRS